MKIEPKARKQCSKCNQFARHYSHTCIARRTFTAIRCNRITANAHILARLRQAIVDICLAPRPTKSNRTRAFEAVYHVEACAAVQARLILALVDVDLALCARKAGHTNAPERSRVVEAAAVILARMALALVDVRLAP